MRLASALLVVACLVLAGCASSPSGTGPQAEEVRVMHAHALVAEGPDDLLMATHHGLVRGERANGTWSWAYVGAERYDLMGFVAGTKPGEYYSSGHPSDPAAYGGPNLGLRRSLDGGQTWEVRSYKGTVDFHAMAARPDTGALVGLWGGSIKDSADAGATWTDSLQPQGAPVTSLAASDGLVWAGTTFGIHKRTAPNEWERLNATGLPGGAYSLTVSRDGQTLLATAGNQRELGTYRSADGGKTWSRLEGDLAKPANLVHFALVPGDPAHAFAVTSTGAVYEDPGTGWVKIRA